LCANSKILYHVHRPVKADVGTKAENPRQKSSGRARVSPVDVDAGNVATRSTDESVERGDGERSAEHLRRTFRFDFDYRDTPVKL